MTATGDLIKQFVSYSLTDWVVTQAEQAKVLALFRADRNVPATIRDLDRDGMLDELMMRVQLPDLRDALVQVLAARCDPGSAALVRKHIAGLPGFNQIHPYFSWTRLFDICHSTMKNLVRFGMSFGGGSPPISGLAGSTATAAFSGSGATGANPTRQSIPTWDMVKLAAGHSATTQRYKNPLGSLTAYLGTLTPAQRMQQARSLVRQPISTVFPETYVDGRPSRAEVMRKAAKVHNLHAALIAGFVLAEQRDQSRNEDAADYVAATSIRGANTSIGLGQVVVSTAKRNDLFTDLLPKTITSSLGHKEIATLLASDEFNIFAVARYIRKVANQAARMSATNLAKTKSAYAGFNVGAYANNSSTWPDDNVRAMGSEYTSRAWDGKIFAAWGDFVFEAYQNLKHSGAL